MYGDYDREMFSEFMNNGESAEGMALGAGSLIRNAYNLKGDMIGPRTADGCSDAPHFSKTDPDGCNSGWTTIMREGMSPPQPADWVMQSLCSAHLEEKHQWGPGIGFEDDLFITNEEWTGFRAGSNYTGITAHVVELATGNVRGRRLHPGRLREDCRVQLRPPRLRVLRALRIQRRLRPSRHRG
jgi:hypothetical protein